MNEINLESYESFMAYIDRSEFIQAYDRDRKKAATACNDLKELLEHISEQYGKDTGKNLFVHVGTARVKDKESFFRKMYNKCCYGCGSVSLNERALKKYYKDVKDIAGVRFACSYTDEIVPAITIIRPELLRRGHAPDLNGRRGPKDNDYLNKPGPDGYRAYHFFVKFLITVDEYNEKQEEVLCEVQGRSELQHVWAVKSHDLIYKPLGGRDVDDPLIKREMANISNMLATCDESFNIIKTKIQDITGGS
jgi:ppGpp synthetase/RelA/SpoT-type nucleotidyltranferase